MRQIEEPIVTQEDGAMAGERYSHPAFGQITVSRVSGNSYLYGSDFQHQHYVVVTIKRSEMLRSLARDWYSDRGDIISVALSEAQWAAFVSSFNMGAGTPCTIERLQGVGLVPGLPAPDRARKFKVDASDELKDMIKDLEDLKAMVTAETSGLSKKKQDAIVAKVDRTLRTVTSSIPFIQEQFDEHIEGSIEKVHIEAHSYMAGLLQRAGLEALQSSAHPLEITHAE